MAEMVSSPNIEGYQPYKKPRFRRLMQRTVIPWLFILPILAIHILVVAIPSVSAIYYSMTDWKGIGEANFVGLANFKRLLNDAIFLKALKNNFVWLGFFITVPFILALAAASLLAQIKRGAMFYRLAIFIPYILPSVVTTNIWRNLMSPRRGLGAQFTATPVGERLVSLGMPDLGIPFLGRTETVLLSIAFIDNWHFWGFLTILFLVAMQNVPMDLYDAAKIDGANRWQQFLNVTLPGIRPTLLFMLMMTAIWSFLVFEYVWILTQGGPAGASEVLGTYVYKQAFQRFETGYAAAMGLTMSSFAGLIIMIFIFLRKRGWDI